MNDAAIPLALMAALSAAEALFPFRREAGCQGRIKVNFVLTVVTFSVNLILNAAILSILSVGRSAHFGLLLYVNSGLALAATIILLDLAAYGAHAAMHRSPNLWRFHRVHHTDTMVDVTTAFRQHPIEGLFRYGVLGSAGLLLGPDPAAFALYRLLSAVNAVFEHANINAPFWLARAMSTVTTWPYFHKIHHSRYPIETDTNYGNLLSIWDRVFGTITCVSRARFIVYGLERVEARVAETVVSAFCDPLIRRPG